MAHQRAPLDPIQPQVGTSNRDAVQKVDWRKFKEDGGSLSIFLDAENIFYNLLKDHRQHVQYLLASVAGMKQYFSQKGVIKNVIAAGGLHRLDLASRQALYSLGVRFHDVPPGIVPDAADYYLLLEMTRVMLETPPPHTFVIISNDRDFIPMGLMLIKQGYYVVRVHSEGQGRRYGYLFHESVHWDNFATERQMDNEHRGGPRSTALNPVMIVDDNEDPFSVMDFSQEPFNARPKDQTIRLPQKSSTTPQTLPNNKDDESSIQSSFVPLHSDHPPQWNPLQPAPKDFKQPFTASSVPQTISGGPGPLTPSSVSGTKDNSPFQSSFVPPVQSLPQKRVPQALQKGPKTTELQIHPKNNDGFHQQSPFLRILADTPSLPNRNNHGAPLINLSNKDDFQTQSSFISLTDTPPPKQNSSHVPFPNKDGFHFQSSFVSLYPDPSPSSSSKIETRGPLKEVPQNLSAYPNSPIVIPHSPIALPPKPAPILQNHPAYPNLGPQNPSQTLQAKQAGPVVIAASFKFNQSSVPQTLEPPRAPLRGKSPPSTSRGGDTIVIDDITPPVSPRKAVPAPTPAYATLPTGPVVDQIALSELRHVSIPGWDSASIAELTVELWLYLPNTGRSVASGRILGKEGLFSLFCQTNNMLLVGFKQAGELKGSAVSLPTNKLFHLSVSYTNQNKVAIHINGQLTRFMQLTSAPERSVVKTPLLLGSPHHQNLSFYMSHVRIWDTVLTPQEITHSMQTPGLSPGSYKNLVAWWPLDHGGTVIIDKGPFGLHGRFVGGQAWMKDGRILFRDLPDQVPEY